MGKTVALAAEDAAYCRDLFERYYRSAPLPTPPELPHREFAFAPFEEGSPSGGSRGFAAFLRHRSLRDAAELRRNLVGLVPRHAYYSTSIYEKPDHPNMKDKGWLGADLVFDLDADHLREAEKLSYPGQLLLARDRFRYLLDEFLFGDFGLKEHEVTLTFSGGRGYHAHVHSDGFRRLTGGERRELVDYIMGTGFDPLQGAFYDEVPQKEEGARASSRTYRRIRAPTDPGWKGRMSRGVHRWIEERRTMDESALAVEVEMLLSRPAGGASALPSEAANSPIKPSREARVIAKDLSRPETQRAILENQTLEAFPHDRSGEKVRDFLGAMLRGLSVDLQGEMDAPVTTDVHRLIRMPGSLHGGTGFVVRTLRRDELDSFDPFVLALPSWAPADGGGSAKGTRATVTLAQDVDYPFGMGGLRGKAGEHLELDPPQTLFLLLRGEATLRSGTPPAP